MIILHYFSSFIKVLQTIDFVNQHSDILELEAVYEDRDRHWVTFSKPTDEISEDVKLSKL